MDKSSTKFEGMMSSIFFIRCSPVGEVSHALQYRRYELLKFEQLMQIYLFAVAVVVVIVVVTV